MDGLIAARAGQTAAGVLVNQQAVVGIPAVQSCVEFAAEAVAQLEMGVWTKSRPLERVVDCWQAKAFSRRPNPMQSEFEFWHSLEASLGYRNNAFVWKTLGRNGEVLHRTALHPGQVMAWRGDRGGLLYDVYFHEGYPLPPDVDGYGVIDKVDSDVVLHIRGRGGSGELLAPTPIQRFRKALGLAVSKQEHEASLLANGAGYGLLATFPPTVKPEEAEVWRKTFDARHAGPGKAGRTMTVGGGAAISNISMTQVDAQFVESVELSMRDACLIYHIPEWLLGVGVGAKGATKPGTPEHEMQRWLYFYLGPRLKRIESAFNADRQYFDVPDIRCMFETFDVIRGDLQTEDTIAHQQIQDGRLLVDEWREEHGREPLPDGLGKIPQITPVGGAPNKPVTGPVQPKAAPEEEDDEDDS